MLSVAFIWSNKANKLGIVFDMPQDILACKQLKQLSPVFKTVSICFVIGNMQNILSG